MTNKGLTYISRYLKDDLTAGLGLALVVLPLALGIGVASGTPPIAGVIAAIIGGVVATFFRGSHMTINGPSAGLIAVMLVGGLVLSDGDPMTGFYYLLAATVVAGSLQMMMGLLRFGEIIDIMPSAAINGMLAAVGLTIVGTQFHTILGVTLDFDNAFDSLGSIPQSLQHLNPIVTTIGLVAASVLFLHSRLDYKLVQSLPAPLWIVLFSIPFVYYFNFFQEHQALFITGEVLVGPQYLVELPQNWLVYWSSSDTGSMLGKFHLLPNFGKISSYQFWLVVLSITIISTIETLVSAKVVDKLDPLERHTNLNKELFAAGISTVASGFLGGLPVITAIPVYSGAKTKWSNLFYGLFLMVFLLLFGSIIQLIPLAALAVLLVYTGYQLARPTIWVNTYQKGDDQFLIFLTTLLSTLVYGLLVGTVVAIATTLFIHYVKSGLSRKQFLVYLRSPSIEVERTKNIKELYIRLKGIVNFVNIPQLKKALRHHAKEEQHIIVDMASTLLADYTVLEYLQDEAPRYDLKDITFEVVGLGAHDATSRHPNATRILPDDKKPQLNQRQSALKTLTEVNNGIFWPEVRWNFDQLSNFESFKNRTINYTLNTAKGHYKMFFEWETCDITFNKNSVFLNQGQHTSIAILHLPFNAPTFVLQTESLADRLGMVLSLRESDINFESHPKFSSLFLLRGTDEPAVRRFFGTQLLNFLTENPGYQLESNGTMLLIMRDMRFASPSEMERLHGFSFQLAELLLESWKSQPIDLEALL